MGGPDPQAPDADSRRSDPPQDPTSGEPPRAGRCAIVGRPNVGKSTLVNTLLGQKLVIATPTPGTTRATVLGVYAQQDPPTQIAFLDTPGLARRRTTLTQVLSDEAKASLLESDVVLMMTDVGKSSTPNRLPPGDERVLDLVRTGRRPALLAINKVDRLPDKSVLLPLIDAYHKRAELEEVVPISATEGTNLAPLVEAIRSRLPEGLMYDGDFLTDRPERFFVAELVREAVLRHTREEVPHGVAIVLDQYEEEGNLVRITATVVVEKPSHKKMVIGSKGQRIKQIGTEARLEIEPFLERRVYLQLWVKVVPGWTTDPSKAKRLIREQTT